MRTFHPLFLITHIPLLNIYTALHTDPFTPFVSLIENREIVGDAPICQNFRIFTLALPFHIMSSKLQNYYLCTDLDD